MCVIFGLVDIAVEVNYDGKVDPREHSHRCTLVWKEVPKQEWVHGFIHTRNDSHEFVS